MDICDLLVSEYRMASQEQAPDSFDINTINEEESMDKTSKIKGKICIMSGVRK